MAVTIKTISQAAGVSVASVSKVLNGDYSKVSAATRDRVLRIADEMDYRPNQMARNLVRRKSTLIGLLIPDISNPYYAEMCRGVIDESMRFGYSALIANTDSTAQREQNEIRNMSENNVAGVILVGNAPTAAENIAMLRRYRLPYISVDNPSKDIDLDYCVYVDDFSGSYHAIEYLIEHGHTQIAYISGMPSDARENDRRLLGYLAAMRDHNLLIDPNLIENGTFTLETGYRKTLQLLGRRQPITAIACGNDMIALGAFNALRERRIKVPHDISLVGFDDVYLSTVMQPRMTTVRQPAYEMGVCAASMLMDRINNVEMENKSFCFKPSLVERDTVSFRVAP